MYLNCILRYKFKYIKPSMVKIDVLKSLAKI